ncbi:uncharacterized protein BP01DRAFT_382178 [Aspergillus saccharolyticus JOP 1030-1]|uniref:Uncharacterized protein n=1 Tax=Aspergillus saccharolyticus JOP 1030-1 TaxID=1450539 RepID=A0A318ZG03_9EURO|nr:hypothetical protein BP01DRAFT_382178 [Aspergillus saccharolyticus JOP 1030-1]PYH45995.1 hypothetical protein BP01DRAFT_382178 [Aspergillus saccharolyticus JOP 1030-1]
MSDHEYMSPQEDQLSHIHHPEDTPTEQQDAIDQPTPPAGLINLYIARFDDPCDWALCMEQDGTTTMVYPRNGEKYWQRTLHSEAQTIGTDAQLIRVASDVPKEHARSLAGTVKHVLTDPQCRSPTSALFQLMVVLGRLEVNAVIPLNNAFWLLTDAYGIPGKELQSKYCTSQSSDGPSQDSGHEDQPEGSPTPLRELFPEAEDECQDAEIAAPPDWEDLALIVEKTLDMLELCGYETDESGSVLEYSAP